MYRVNPLSDHRWDRFLSDHPNSSVFHSSAWIKSLHLTYGYDVILLTTCPPEAELRNGILLCHVASCLTGRRLVSLPFSDHCEVLTGQESDVASFHAALTEELRGKRLRYIELRPVRPLASFGDAVQGSQYCFHRLDLAPSLDSIFSKFHRDSIQRKIRRAEREWLSYEEGSSDALLSAFLRLRLLTQRRHLAPPQPKVWFRHLVENFGKHLKIRVAFKDNRAIAAILTLRHKDTMVYKYGCSDERYHSLGGMHLLLWRSIQEAKQMGLALFDLGRSDWTNPGLITFKDRWGAQKSELNYCLMRRPERSALTHPAQEGWAKNFGRRLASHLPDALFQALGASMYRHFG